MITMQFVEEYIEKDLALFKRLNLDKKEIHCILAAGEMIPETYYHIKETKKDFEGFLPDKIFTKKKMLKLMGNIHAQSLLPTLLLMRKITQLTDCQNILLSPINLCDGWPLIMQSKSSVFPVDMILQRIF